MAVPNPSRSAPPTSGTTLKLSTLAIAGSLLLGGVVPSPATAQEAEATAFRSSFEAEEPQKPLLNQVEAGPDGFPVQQNVRGAVGGSLLTSLNDVAASGENVPGEAADFAADGNPGSKWLVFTNTAWLNYGFTQSATATQYSLTSANDAPERDPKDWKIEGSNDGVTWTTVDTQVNQNWAAGERGTKKTYTIASPGAYSTYRLDITANHAGNIIQLADWDLIASDDEQGTPPMVTSVGNGPSSGYNMKARVGFTGVQSLRYAGEHVADGEAAATNRLFDVSIPVGDSSRLSYRIFPELTGNDLQYPSTHTAINLHFTDGTTLDQLAPVDEYDIAATAEGQGTGKVLYPNQWNHVEVELGSIAAGKTIDRVLLSYDNPDGSAATKFQGWLDDVTLDPAPSTIDGSSLTNFVDTRRGTNSSSAFSRGSNEVITAVPNGFNFLAPVTNALATSRNYSYQQDNDDLNRPQFEGLGISHQPSPWMGDRNQFSVMPVAGATKPSGNPDLRAQSFNHDKEVAQPEYYGVDLDNGVKAEMTPTNRGMIMQFTFPGSDGSIVFDSPTGDGSFTIDPVTGKVTGWIDHGSGFRAGQTRMFISGYLDQKPTATGVATGGRPLTTYASFSLGEARTVTLRAATSLISLDQATRNLEMEVGQRSFDDVRSDARNVWNDRLDVIAVEGASETEMTTLYSNLYRLNVYPNAQFENVGTVEAPEFKYASPVSKPVGTSTGTTTGAKVVSGKMYVNNGFWDTYRTTWPAYSMLYPEVAAELVDGFTDQYRDGGWIARWSSPGYANIMTGTSSDVSFADAYLRGVELPDALATYDAAVKNASTPSADQSVGRKSLNTSTFLGYTPASQGESVSWATEGYINDAGIGRMAAALAADPRTAEERRARLLEESEYYLDRARNYVNLFDPSIGFFQARNADGSFAVPAEQYNPTAWFGPYTETNGWNFAFHAPQDPQGLVNLYGGRAGMEEKLDTFFATPETSLGPIHEEVEARDGRFGQWGVSNQVSHHIPFMYNAVGAPAKAQKIVREALQRSFSGTKIGQGYPGDEDNGEMSAWYIFSALGLYPMQAGTEELVIGSPLFTKATVQLAGGKELVINAPEADSSNVYVQGLKVDGEDYSKTSISSRTLTDGATLDFTLGAEPSAWGTQPEDALPSLTTGDQVANPHIDTTDAGLSSTTSSGGENANALVDNTLDTQVTFASPNPSVTMVYRGAKQRPAFYTLTAGAGVDTDPSGWVLEGSNDGQTWTTVDERSGFTFANRSETAPFKVANPGAFQQFRLSVTAGDATIALSEIELLTNGEGSDSNTLTVTPQEGLATSSGIDTDFALGILSGPSPDPAYYSATIKWGDGSEEEPVTVGSPRAGNFALTSGHTFEKPGVYTAVVTVSGGDETTSTPVNITVDYIEPGSLTAAFDSVCIGDDGVGANCDAKGVSYPRAGLAAGGFVPGAVVPVPGTDLTFTVPTVDPGKPDNATGAGQTIAVDLGAGATSLSFIGAATERNQDTAATVTFTDGSTAQTPLQFSDWTKGGNANATAPYGNIQAIRSEYRLVGGGRQNVPAFLFSTVPFTIPAGKTVQSITMPTQPGEPGVTGRVHVFAMASNGAVTDNAFEAAAGTDVTATAGQRLDTVLATIQKAAPASADPIARVNWGDGMVEDAAVAFDGTGAGTVDGSHVYTDPGTYSVHVTVANGSGTQHLSLTATVVPAEVYTPTLALTPEDGVQAGGSVDLIGTGFGANETVALELQAPTPVTLEVQADGNGAISTALTVPSDLPSGRYPIVATGAQSKVPATATLVVVPPIVNPVYDPQFRVNSHQGRPGDTVTVTGAGFAPGEQLDVTMNPGSVSVGNPVVNNDGSINFEFVVPAAIRSGKYSITVVGDVSASPTEVKFKVQEPKKPKKGKGHNSGPTAPEKDKGKGTKKPSAPGPAPTVSPTRKK